MQQIGLYEQAEQRMEEYLMWHKMRNTPERRLILKLVVKHPGRFTPNDMIKWVEPNFISKATVYNALSMLEKAHIITCLHKQHAGRLMEYELALGEQSSINLICSKCGRTSRVKNESADVALFMRGYPNFIMRHYSVYLFGECKHCKKLDK